MRRPTWAKGLSDKQWDDLCSCQKTTSPTLKQLRADVGWQKDGGAVCRECWSALATIQEHQSLRRSMKRKVQKRAEEREKNRSVGYSC